jgi:hypothetical protein
MVPSLALAITTSSERLSSNVFSLDESIRFRNLKFITDHFGSLSLSPMGMVQMPQSWAHPAVGYRPYCV